MKIGILAFQSRQYQKYTEAEFLAEQVEALGHELVFLRWDELAWNFADGKIEVLWHGKPLPQLDVILARPRVYGDPSTIQTVLQAIEDAGYLLINGPNGIRNAKSKAHSQVLFHQHNIPTPTTRFIYDASQLEAATHDMSWPIIIKSIYGSFGVGVFSAPDTTTARPIVDFLTRRGFDDPAIIQELIPEANEDIRAFVVGDQVVASMTRKAAGDDFRANLHQDAEGSPIELTPEEIELAVRSAKAFELDIAGVDLVRTTNKGTLVLEVNSNPGMTGITEVTGVNVRQSIIEHAVARATATQR